MIQALNVNPYSTTAKTAEIMARYRPIAPKPESPGSSSSTENPNMPPNITKSPYLRNVWPHLQARPTRTRKRGRTALAPPAVKRARTHHASAPPNGLSLPYQFNASPAKTLSLTGFAHCPNGLTRLPVIPNLLPLKCGLETPVTTPSEAITVPLLPQLAVQVVKPSGLTIQVNSGGGDVEEFGRRAIDLNVAAEAPEELDITEKQPQGTNSPRVITPRPVRPVGSSICVGSISEDDTVTGSRKFDKQVVKKREEVEKEVEEEQLPAAISDSSNNVRLTNSAYKEMVGQPECCWLDYMPFAEGKRGRTPCKRIGGEVMLRFSDSGSIPKSSNGFSCWVRIEWGSNEEKNSIGAFCDVTRLACESKDYLFEWRFHTRSESSESASQI